MSGIHRGEVWGRCAALVVVLGAGALVLTIGALVGCSDSASGAVGGDGRVDTTRDAGSGDSAVSQRAEVRGTVVQYAMDDEMALAGVTISSLADPSLTATSDAAGAFSLQVPVGVSFVHVEQAGQLASIFGFDVPASGLRGVETGLVPGSALDLITSSLSSLPARDATKGHVVVEFDVSASDWRAAGTEHASLSGASAGAFVFDAEGDAVAGDTLVQGSDEGTIGFLNVAPGTVKLTIAAPGCAAQLPADQAYPVRAATFTFVHVTCTLR